MIPDDILSLGLFDIMNASKKTRNFTRLWANCGVIDELKIFAVMWEGDSSKYVEHAHYRL